jgi:hypothetical protein
MVDWPNYWTQHLGHWPEERQPRRPASLFPPVDQPSGNGHVATPSRGVPGIVANPTRVQRREDRSPSDQAQMDQLVADTYAYLRTLKRDR